MLLFARREPRPCPVLDVIEAGHLRTAGVLGVGGDSASHGDGVQARPGDHPRPGGSTLIADALDSDYLVL